MRQVLTLIAKDLRRRVAEPMGIVISLVIPLAIAGTMALALGNHGDDKGPQLRLLVLDLDDSPLSGILLGSTQNPEAARRMEVKRVATREEGLSLLKEEEFTALLVIPQRFSDALLGGEQVQLELIKNPAQSIMPIVAEQGAEVVALYLSGAAKLLGPDASSVIKLLSGEGWNDLTGL
ncbi:MAG TPA: ABC transporter permease, partial [Candidatus Polarisedimenticolia bacterium]|nr:ABC transporter permease [Candidatus Polarisedimenticolia bacterium]